MKQKHPENIIKLSIFQNIRNFIINSSLIGGVLLSSSTYAITQQEIEGYKRLADQGDGYYQVIVGQIYTFGLGVKTDKEEATRYFKRAQSQGDAETQYQIGRVFDTGLLGDINHKEALSWFKKAAKQKHVESMYQVGRYYQEGLSVDPNPKRAYSWFEKAAKKDHVKAAYQVGIMNRYDVDLINYEKAALFLAQASFKFHIKATHELGLLYYYGLGVPKDKERAFELFLDASGYLYGESFYYLAVSAVNGEGTEQSYGDAYYYLLRSQQYAIEDEFNLQSFLKEKLDAQTLIDAHLRYQAENGG